MRRWTAVFGLCVAVGWSAAAEFRPETLRRRDWTVAPGVKISALTIPEIPCEIRLVAIDTAVSGLRFDVRQGRGALFTTANLGEMAADLKNLDRRYPAAGINGDFFNNNSGSETYGNPVGLTISGGRLMTTGIYPPDGYASLYQTIDGKLRTGVLKFSGTLRAGDRIFPLDGVNAVRHNLPADPVLQPSSAVLFTPYWTGKLPFDGVRVRFAAPPRGADGVRLHGRAAGRIRAGEKLSGDECDGAVVGLGVLNPTVAGLSGPVELEWHFSGADAPLRDAIRIWTVPLENGELRATHEVGNYPRTMFGLGENRLVMLVADARQPGWSRGLPSLDAARILRAEGCVYAGQFDGGGSASVWACGRYLNRPGDGRPRKVGNAIFFSSDRPLPEWKIPGDFPGSPHGLLWGL